jgi:hypothetical protein
MAMSEPDDDRVTDPANFYRRTYAEEDIQVLIASPRFLIAVDAYGAGRCSLEQMLALAFTRPPYLPRNLHLYAFADLVFEVVRRINSGELKVPSEWKDEYSEFYRQQPPAPLDELPM